VTASTVTRELACLSLGHEDADEPRCSSTDDDLLRQLVDEVQHLRVAAGIVEETDADRAEQEGALDDAFDAVARAFATGNVGERALGFLRDLGWRLVRTPRP
jgi:hypothetical protein